MKRQLLVLALCCSLFTACKQQKDPSRETFLYSNIDYLNILENQSNTNTKEIHGTSFYIDFNDDFDSRRITGEQHEVCVRRTEDDIWESQTGDAQADPCEQRGQHDHRNGERVPQLRQVGVRVRKGLMKMGHDEQTKMGFAVQARQTFLPVHEQEERGKTCSCFSYLHKLLTAFDS